MLEEAKPCPHCGAALSGWEALRLPENKWVCPHCGNEVFRFALNRAGYNQGTDRRWEWHARKRENV